MKRYLKNILLSNLCFHNADNEVKRKIVTNRCYSSSHNVDNEVKRKVVIFGKGYLGMNIIKNALAKHSDLEIISISKSGKPLNDSFNEDGKVIWKKGDVLLEQDWQDQLIGADAVISCIGAFGSNAFMEQINGDANINLISQSLKAKVKRFVYISTVDNNLPSFILKGYFNGKRRTEEALLDSFGATGGVILRPGFMYGTRSVPMPKLFHNLCHTLYLPLGVVGRPLKDIFNLSPIRTMRNTLPGMRAILEVPIDVDDVAKVALGTALGYNIDKPVLNVDDIQTIAKKLN